MDTPDPVPTHDPTNEVLPEDIYPTVRAAFEARFQITDWSTWVLVHYGEHVRPAILARYRDPRPIGFSEHAQSRMNTYERLLLLSKLDLDALTTAVRHAQNNASGSFHRVPRCYDEWLMYAGISALLAKLVEQRALLARVAGKMLHDAQRWPCPECGRKGPTHALQILRVIRPDGSEIHTGCVWCASLEEIRDDVRRAVGVEG